MVSRGRSLSRDRTTSILVATLDRLRETGYEAMRMQDVAAAAGCGLGTIYRRWATKPELVSAAFLARLPVKIPITEPPRADLTAAINVLLNDYGFGRSLVIGFVAAAQHEPILQTAVEQLIADARNLLADRFIRLVPSASRERAEAAASTVIAGAFLAVVINQPPSAERLADEGLARLGMLSD